jgi:hypothetical protein
MYIGLQIKYPLVLSDCNKTWILTDFLKILKFQENPSSRPGQTDMIKVIVASPDFANMAKNECFGLQMRTQGAIYPAGFIKKTNHNWTTCLKS